MAAGDSYPANISTPGPDDDPGSRVAFDGFINFTDDTDQPAPGDGPFLPTGWTEDDGDPANVSSNGGILTSFFASPASGGAMPSLTFVSGTGKQVDAGFDVSVFVPVTYDNSSGDATLEVELSPDDDTYTAVGTITWKTFIGAVAANVYLLTSYIPAGWFVRLTAVNATLGTAHKTYNSAG